MIKEFNLEQFIFFAPRTDFVSANREGIFSLVGYVSLQMIGIGIGNILYKSTLSGEEIKLLKAGKPIEQNVNSIDQRRKDWFVFFKVSGITFLFYCAYLVSQEVFAPPSRRLCNMAFVLYHTAAGLAGVSMSMLMDLTNGPRQINTVEDAVNYN